MLLLGEVFACRQMLQFYGKTLFACLYNLFRVINLTVPLSKIGCPDLA